MNENYYGNNFGKKRRVNKLCTNNGRAVGFVDNRSAIGNRKGIGLPHKVFWQALQLKLKRDPSCPQMS